MDCGVAASPCAAMHVQLVVPLKPSRLSHADVLDQARVAAPSSLAQQRIDVFGRGGRRNELLFDDYDLLSPDLDRDPERGSTRTTRPGVDSNVSAWSQALSLRGSL